MSSHARSASAHFDAESHIRTDDERPLPQDAETDREPNSEGDDRRMSQPRRRWISEIEWTNYVQGDSGVRRRQSSDVAIFRVPNFLKNEKRDYYVPQRVSLGPLHHRSAELPPMGHHKGKALRRMKKRCHVNALDNMTFANRAKDEILKLENEIRDSYEEDIDCDGETLARMLCLDGCFLLEVLRTLGGDPLSTAKARKYYDAIFGEKKLSYAAIDVTSDILILENQIPLIILRKLVELELNSAVEVEKHLNVLMGIISAVFNPFDNKNIDKAEYWSWLERAEQEVHHLLGFLHTVIASPQSSRQGKCDISIDCCSQCIIMLRDKSKAGGEHVDQRKCSFSIDCCGKQCIMKLYNNNKAGNDYMARRIPHAVELRNAGIKFKQSDGGIKEIKFDENSATIFLPPISIEDGTERVFRNLIAYEMCKPSQINYVSSYVGLMDGMIDSEEDVALLRRMGIMSNWLGSDKEAADLFNGLGKEVVLGWNDHFKELKQNVRKHHRNKFKVQFAELARDHFSSPWKALALVGAIVVLVLTALQTIYTMK